MSGLVTDLLRGVGAALSDLERAVRDTAGWRDLLAELGWDAVPLPPAIAAIATPAGELVAAADELERGVTPAAIERARSAVVAVVDALDALSGLDLGAPGLGADLAAATFDHLVIRWLARKHPVLYAALIAVGLVEVRYVREPPRPGFQRRRLRWDNVGRLLDRPSAAWAVAFGWGAGFDAQAWTEAISDLVGATGLDAAVEVLPDELVARLTAAGAVPATPLGCTVRLLDTTASPGGAEVAGRIIAVARAGLDGIALVPVVRGAASLTIALAPGLALAVQAGAELDGVGIVVIDAAGAATPIAMTALTGGLRIALRWAFGAQPLATIDGTRGLWASGAELAATLAATGDDLDLGVELGLIDGRVRTSASDGDGFLSSVVPDVDAPVALTVAWSNRHGLQLRGAGGLAVAIPVGRQVGPARIDELQLALAGQGDGVALRAQVAASIALGPVTASIAGLGVELVVARGAPPRLLGALDAHAAPTWPSAIGLSIASPAASGAGLLVIDEHAHRYAGGVAIRIADRFDLTAIGVIDTRLPDGTPGFSLVFLIDTVLPTPVLLGLNFYLVGVGGLLGLHRTVDVDRLRSGLRDGGARSILFPTDVVANLTAIVSQLGGYFPARRGQFVIGPMARITWSSPPLIVIDAALVIEFPDPLRVVLAGVLRAAVPDPDHAILDLKVAFLGTLDLPRGMLALDASLYDSYLGRGGFRVNFEGDFAIRLAWGEHKDFVATVGGFHPAYTAPAYLGLPALRRVSMSLLKDNPRLRLAAYVALTTNTVQFGAELDFSYRVSGFSVVGELGFDVLFQWDPFHFDAAVRAHLAVRAGGSDICSLSLAFELEGTTPWRARGEASFGILFFSITVHFDKTWGEDQALTSPEVAVLPAVLAELGRDVHWTGAASAVASPLVQLVPAAQAAGAPLIDPAALLEIRQSLVPLGAVLARFNNARPSDISAIDVVAVTIAGAPVAPASLAAVDEEFAPAAFRELSDADKLAAASYEPMKGGVVVAGHDALVTDYLIGRPVRYEQLVDDGTPGVPPVRSETFARAALFAPLVRGGAVGTSPLSRKAAVQRQRRAVRAVTADEDQYSVVSTADLRVVDAASHGLSRSQALARRAALLAAGHAADDLDIIPAYRAAS